MITDAWVIHKSWSGDTSARVVFFTREQGLVHCLYKGGRTPTKQALLQAFIPLWLAMDVRGNAHFVRRLEIAAAPLALLGQNLFAGLYVNELLHHALKPQDPMLALYSAYVLAIQALMQAADRFAIERVLRRFEWVLLTCCGYCISLTHDMRTARPIEPHLYYQFIAGEGFVRTDKGINGAHLIAMSEDHLDDVAVLGVAKKVMRRAIDHMLEGKEIKTRRLFIVQ